MSVVIKMKGLPFESTAKDIQQFFEGLYLREEDIHLAAYKDGKASGISFAVFQSDEDARQAMFRNEKYMGKRYIELFLSSSTEMKTVLQDGVPDPRAPRQEKQGQGGRKSSDFQEQLRSRNPSRQDQRRPRNVLDRLGRSPNRQGDERKGFSSREEVNRDRSRSPRRRVETGREYRGRGSFRGRQERGRGRGRGRSNFDHDVRQVEVSGVPSLFDIDVSQLESKGRNDTESLERFQNIRNERANTRGSMESRERYQKDFRERNAFDNDGDNHDGKGYRQESSFGEDRARQREDPLITETCVHLFGLPFQVTEKDIVSFFRGLDVVKVKPLYHASGKFAGKMTGEGYVEFRSVRDAKEAAKKNKQNLGSRYVEVCTCSKMAMLNTTERNEEDMKRSNDNSFRDPKFIPPRHPISDLAINIDTELFKQDLERSRMMDREPNLPNLGLTLPEPYLSTGSLEQQTVSTLNQLASTANINPEDVSAGCVVGIRNLPSSITAEEILDFFYGYAVFPNSVRIHYLSPGRSSGDAMVTFHDSRQATSAIQQLNHRHVGKRSVQLFLV